MLMSRKRSADSRARARGRAGGAKVVASEDQAFTVVASVDQDQGPALLVSAWGVQSGAEATLARPDFQVVVVRP